MNLIFLRSNGTIKNVCKNPNEWSIPNLINQFVQMLNPKYKIYYYRSWNQNGNIWYDIGSHTEFFILTNKVLNDGDLWTY